MVRWFAHLMLIGLCGLMVPIANAAEEKMLYIYAWYNEIPNEVVTQFEKETGINVVIATYNDNEILYAKLKASPHSGFDLVMPSNYYVERMSKQGMLEKLDLKKLSNLKEIPPQFSNPEYDPNNHYSIPFLWGSTGIFVNKKFYDPKTIRRWTDLTDKKYRNKLMLLNDAREVFSIALISQGLNPNSEDPREIKLAYDFLVKLLPNIRVFNSDSLPSIFIDEDLTVGMAWNGDVYRGHKENSDLEYVYPDDGYIIWVDCFSMPKYAPHPNNALLFLNFLLRPEMSAKATKQFGYATANKHAKDFLPKEMQNSYIIFPSDNQLKHSHFQRNLSAKSLQIYSSYWELLKLNA